MRAKNGSRRKIAVPLRAASNPVRDILRLNFYNKKLKRRNGAPLALNNSLDSIEEEISVRKMKAVPLVRVSSKSMKGCSQDARKILADGSFVPKYSQSDPLKLSKESQSSSSVSDTEDSKEELKLPEFTQ